MTKREHLVCLIKGHDWNDLGIENIMGKGKFRVFLCCRCRHTKDKKIREAKT